MSVNFITNGTLRQTIGAGIETSDFGKFLTYQWWFKKYTTADPGGTMFGAAKYQASPAIDHRAVRIYNFTGAGWDLGYQSGSVASSNNLNEFPDDYVEGPSGIDSRWHHVIVESKIVDLTTAWRFENLKMYIDGDLRADTAAGTSFTGNTNLVNQLSLGSMHTSSAFGHMSGVKIAEWSCCLLPAALTTEQVAALQISKVTDVIAGANIIGYSPFDGDRTITSPSGYEFWVSPWSPLGAATSLDSDNPKFTAGGAIVSGNGMNVLGGISLESSPGVFQP